MNFAHDGLHDDLTAVKSSCNPSCNTPQFPTQRIGSGSNSSGYDRAGETSRTVTPQVLTVVTKLSSDRRSVRSKY